MASKMEANSFVTRLKADSPEKYNCDLRSVISDFICILTKIPIKDRGLFGLNVLRTLCWNIDKVPKWRDSVDNTALLTLVIDSVRVTRILDKDDRVKTLACIYHLHKHVVNLDKVVPPELVLKISYMPFELDSKHLLEDYYKTYWNILSDRITYLERLKTKANILKLLPKLTEDIIKVIQIYDSFKFCSAILTFLVKKMHSLFSDNHAKELSQIYKVIFSTLAEKEDLKLFKELPEKDCFDVYMKLNDCLYIIADNSAKLHFKDDVLNEIVHTCIAMIGHNCELLHCFQTFYVNFFCCVTSEKTNVSFVETIFATLENSLQMTEKLGYKEAINATYPYINQLLRLFIEWQVTNGRKPNKFTLKIQESCLKLMLYIMKKLKNCDQILKCEHCIVKSGSHDGLRLSLLFKHFITICLAQNILLTTLFEPLNLIINEQYSILNELEKCANYEKFFRKLQTDIHNCAISLNKAQYFEFSINLFEIYLKNELKCAQMDHKNISRALFNKSICELDCRLYEKALTDAFLSLAYSQEDGLESDKYMSLVMDIKAKELKSRAENDDDDDENVDNFQLTTVLDACKLAINQKLYRDMRPFISKVKFSVLLRHEYSMYVKLWPSIAPVAGVWQSLRRLVKTSNNQVLVENKDKVLQILYDVVIETPSVVRTVHSPYFSNIVRELLDEFNNKNLSVEDKAMQVMLLFLQTEYDLASASEKYCWKNSDTSLNDDNFPSNRTLPQEHTVSVCAIKALHILKKLMPDIHQVTKTRLRSMLQVYQIFVPLLLQLSRDAEAMQLAYYCCDIAHLVGDDESYLHNAGFLVSSCIPCGELDEVISRASTKMAEWCETKLVFLCDVAMYYVSKNKLTIAAKLVRLVQEKVCDAMINQPELNLELAVSRLLDVQSLLVDHNSGPSILSTVNLIQRRYLAISITGTNWAARRHRLLTVRTYTSGSTLRACSVTSSLGLRGRARGAAAPALATEGAGAQARLHALIADVGNFKDAQVRLDTRLKRILGLQTNGAPDSTPSKKEHAFTPKQEVETMRDIKMFRKNETSPSLPWVPVPAMKIPDFFRHNTKCACYACEIPAAIILCCKTACLEALTYACANENEIARNYYDGVLHMIKMGESKLKEIEGNYKEKYDEFVVKSVMKKYRNDFKSTQIESKIAIAFFELKLNNFETADGYIIDIHEIMKEVDNADPYLTNEVFNLIAASVKLKETIKKSELNLDIENLSLTPAKDAKTPEKRPSHPPKQENIKIKVKDEEVPKKRTVPKQIKIEDDDENDFEKPKTRRTKKDEFKVPNPVIPKPVLEEATPRPLKALPKLLITQPSEEIVTPSSKDSKNEFFTPGNSTPEQFFTPMTSVKTYSKKTLRHNIVKNLEQEFSTPLGKENSALKTNNCNEIKELNSAFKSKLNFKEKTTRKATSLAKDEKGSHKINSDTKIPKTVKKESSSKDVLFIKEDSPVAKEERATKKDVKNVKEDLETKDKLNSRNKKDLFRAVSPGKLTKDKETNLRPRRVRQLKLD